MQRLTTCKKVSIFDKKPKARLFWCNNILPTFNLFKKRCINKFLENSGHCKNISLIIKYPCIDIKIELLK